MPIAVTEDLLRAVVTKDKALSAGRTLWKKGSLQKLHALADHSLLWGECQGSGAKPYIISIDLSGDNPTIRCTCPVKPPPCKHCRGRVGSLARRTGYPDPYACDAHLDVSLSAYRSLRAPRTVVETAPRYP